MFYLGKFIKRITLALTLTITTYSAPALAELKMFHIHNLSVAQIEKLRAMGLDIAHIKKQALSGDDLTPVYRIDIAVSPKEENNLLREGYKLQEMQSSDFTKRHGNRSVSCKSMKHT